MRAARDRLFALVPCAGVGARSGASLPKQYVSLAGRPAVAHTLEALASVDALEAILVCCPPPMLILNRSFLSSKVLGPGWNAAAEPPEQLQ